jgi:hypothetical protein
VWTTNGGYHFDNFAIGYNLEDAFSFADETFVVKARIEDEQNKKESSEQRKQAREQKLAEGGFVNTLQFYLAEAFELLGEQPPVAIVMAVLLFFVTIFFMLPSSKSKPESEVTVPESATEDMANKNEAEPSENSSASEEPQKKQESEEEVPSKGKKRTKKVD